jgi:phage terminase large subunit-like protein
MTKQTTPTSTRTTEYAESVLAGTIPAGNKVRLACQRHLDDLKRQSSDDYPYRFDEEKAAQVLGWMERNCKPSQGDFQKLELRPWDHFVLGSLFGWVEKDSGLRRFRSGLIFVARKNGKTVKTSAVSLYATCKDGERGARVYQLANAMKQARITFDECRSMVFASPKLNENLRVLRDTIHYDKRHCKIEPQAADSERLDGLNTHLAVFDEIHEYKHYKLINVIKNSTASRTQPLIVYITTAGYVLDGPLMDMYEHATDVLEGVVADERSFFYLAELDKDDDVEDHSKWAKANPNLGVSVNLDDMIAEWEQRKHIPAERADFLTKRLNLFVRSGEQSFVDFEVLKRNEGSIDLAGLDNKQCIAGFDLSQTEDFTSACLEFPLDDGRVYVLSHSWIPEVKVKRDNENLPFDEWERLGYLTICPGEYVEYEYVYKWFVEKARRYHISLVTYDPANAYRLVNDLQQYGGEEWTKVVRQGAITLSPALKDLKELLLAGKVVSNQDPMLRWYINNVKLVDDRNGNWLPSKQGAYRKIDGFAAWLNAHTETMKLALPDPAGPPPVTFLSRKDL